MKWRVCLGSWLTVSLGGFSFLHLSCVKFLWPGHRLGTYKLGHLLLIPVPEEWQRLLVNANTPSLREPPHSSILSAPDLETPSSVNTHKALMCLSVQNIWHCALSPVQCQNVLSFSLVNLSVQSVVITLLRPAGISRLSAQQPCHGRKFWDGPRHGDSHRRWESQHRKVRLEALICDHN